VAVIGAGNSRYYVGGVGGILKSCIKEKASTDNNTLFKLKERPLKALSCVKLLFVNV